MEDQKRITDLVADIVSNYVANNSLPAAELPGLIVSVNETLLSLGSDEPSKAVEPLTPAVSVKKSIGNDYIICLEDGRKFKSLKRHLRTKYNLSPEEYRKKWDLPKDYPMVAPSYAQARSDLAKQMGLGQGGRKVLARSPRSKAEA